MVFHTAVLYILLEVLVMPHLAQFTVINELWTMSVNECTEAQSILPADRERDRKRNVIFDAVAQHSVPVSVSLDLFP